MNTDKFSLEYNYNNFCKLGLHKVAHLDEPLANHLVRTAQILIAMGASENLCVAGIYHGSYGTQGSHMDEIGDIPETQREILREIVGHQVEQVVYHFSVMSYDSLSKSFRNILKPEGFPELMDRRDGSLITVSRVYFTDLLTLKLADVIAHAPNQVKHTCVNIPEKYGFYWGMVAEYLGDNCLNIWNKKGEIGKVII